MVKDGNQEKNVQSTKSNGLLFAAETISMVEETAEIFFYSGINPSSILKLNSMISQMSHKLLQKVMLPKSRELAVSVIQPITLHINSLGGWFTSGMAGMDSILNCSVPVSTIIEGEACSAATLLSIAGAHRVIHRHSLVMIHQLSSWAAGTYENIKAEFHNIEKMQQMLRAVYLERTKLPEKLLDKTLLKKDVYLSAKESLKYGIVDEII